MHLAWSVMLPSGGVSTCRSTGPHKENWLKHIDHVSAFREFQGEIKNMQVVEDFELTRHQGVIF